MRSSGLRTAFTFGMRSNEFGLYIRSSDCYNWSEIHVTRKKIGEHEQHAEEREQEKNKKIPDEVEKGGDGRCQLETVVKTAVLFTCEMWTIAKAPKQMERN